MLKVLKGMKDVLPAESARWRALEREMRKAALMAGYREIRTPVLEHTELFARSAGESSDVVRKEMYTFLDKGDLSRAACASTISSAWSASAQPSPPRMRS